MKRVLVTGASGFIGSHCLAPLKQRGYDVHAISSRPLSPNGEGATWHQADLLSHARITPLLERIQPTHLLHLAWVATPETLYASPDNFRWVQSSLSLAEAFTQNGGSHMVVAGSCYEYDQRYGLCSEELTPVRSDTAYGTCKHALHELLGAYCRTHVVRLAWPRIFFLYGPHEHPQRLVASVVLALLEGREARCSHGRQLRDFLYVEDVAEALAAIVDSDVNGPVNIGRGAPISLREIVECIGHQIGCPDLLALGALPPRPNEVPMIVADNSRVTDKLGWQPSVSLEDGVARTIAWWKDELLTSAGTDAGTRQR